MTLAQFQQWAADPCLAVLDTETTGLYGQVIEIAIVDASGNTLLNERVRPTCPVEPGAHAVHGITDEMLADRPGWAELWPRFRDAVAGRTVVIYNAEFDVARISASLDAAMPRWYAREDGQPGHPDTYQRFLRFTRAAQCAMRAYASFREDCTGDDRWQKLVNACAQQGVQTADLGHAHSALGDALRTLRLIRAVAGKGEA